MINPEEGKVKIGVFEFTGCAGDALTILHSEDQLLDFFDALDIEVFNMASSYDSGKKLDIALVEGSISSREEIKKLKDTTRKEGRC